MMAGSVTDGVVYIFVCVNAPGVPPNYYICWAREAREKVRQYSSRGTVTLANLNSEAYRERWDKIETALSTPDSVLQRPDAEPAAAPFRPAPHDS